MRIPILALCVLASIPAHGATTALSDAVALVNAGKYPEARELIATISPTAPEYQAGQCYDALCLYGLNERFAFWQAMESLDVKHANVPVAVRQDLAYKQIEVLFYFRKFEDIFPKIQAFQAEYPAATETSAVGEYRIASLFERGMKRIQEGCRLKDETQFTSHWTDGKANLEEFLSLAETLQQTNYSALPKRSLKRDIWVALLTLGNESAVFDEIAPSDAAALEQVKLLKVQLAQKLNADDLDGNLRLMSDFIREFPESGSRKRVEFDIASLSYSRGEALCKEADALDRAGDSTGAEKRRAAARDYFQQMRSLEAQVAEDKTAGITASDVIDLRGDLLSSYCLEGDYGRVLSVAASMIAESAPGELNWIVGKVYEGIAMQSQRPPQTALAAKALDEVLALNSEKKPNRDYYLLLAARWRVRIALDAGDKDKARQVVQAVQDGSYTWTMKDAFLKDHAGLVRP